MTGDQAVQLRVAALQYCAAGTAQETLARLIPMIDSAAGAGAGLICLPEAATFLAASREALQTCLLYTSPSPRDATLSRMPSSA